MTLSEYLKTIGDERAAKKFGVTRRRIESWRLGHRQPRPQMAQRIVAETDGLLSLDDIYPRANPQDAAA
jgi:hypothetical protein